MVGPTANRPEIRFAVKAPSTAPSDPIENATPIPSAVMPRIRTAKTSSTENAIELKRFELPVHMAMLRRYGLPTTQRSPSPISVRKPGRGEPSPARWSGGSSGRWIQKMNSPEPRNDNASSATANGARTIPISRPASPGPTTWAPARLISSLALPSWSCSRATSDGR